MKIRKIKIVIIITIIFLSVFTLATALIFNADDHTSQPFLPQSANGNFILSVSNQSPDLDPVHIKVTIDNQIAVYDNFYVEDYHNYVIYSFKLKKGIHKIEVFSRTTQLTATKTFTVDKQTFGAINFWYSNCSNTPKHISIQFQNAPFCIAFLKTFLQFIC